MSPTQTDVALTTDENLLQFKQQIARLRKTLKDIDKAASKKILVQGARKLQEALDYATGGDACESYRLGVEEAQGEIVSRIRELVKK